MSFTNADPKKFKDYIKTGRDGFDKVMSIVMSMSSKEEEDDDVDLDELFDEIQGVTREKVPEEDVVNIIISELLSDPVNDDKFVFGGDTSKFIDEEDDRVDDSTLFNPNNL